MSKKVTFIYFDMGGVFFGWENYFKNVADEFTVNRQEIINLFNENSEEITKGTMSPEELWEKCREKFSIKDGKDFNFVGNWVNDYSSLLKVHVLAKQLKGKYKIGIISNIYKGMFPLLIKNGKIPDIAYDTKILSYEVGLQKPEKEIYELAQQRSNVDGGEILYIDDSMSFLTVPKQMGWKTVLFDTYDIDKSIEDIKSKIS